MKKNHALAIATTASLALVLAACNSGGNSEPRADGEEVELGFYTDKAAWESSFDAMDEVSGSDGLSLDFTGYSDPTAFESFITQSFRTDSVPDLFTWHTGPRLQDLVEEGLVAETTELWEQAEEDGLVPEGLIDQYTYEGAQYCVPLNVAYWPVYYNQHIFDEYDLQVPDTFDELMDIADTLVDNGEVPFHQMNIIFEFVWFQALLAGNDPETYQGLQTGEASYTDPTVVEAMDQWKQMIDDGYFIDPGVTTDPQALLANGDVAMAYFGTFFTGQLTDVGASSEDDYGMFIMPNMNPAVDEEQMIMESSPLCVGVGSENEGAALEYSEWWMSDEAQSTWSEDRGDVSFNPNADVADPELSALIDDVLAEDSNVSIQSRYLEANPLPVYTRSIDLFGDFVTNAPEPMPLLEELQAEAEEYWAEQE